MLGTRNVALAAVGLGGKIFVLDMGEAVRIGDLAEQMIRLSGKRPGIDVPIVYTGLRPGEKLYEELFHADEHLTPTGHDKLLLAHYRPVEQETLDRCLEAMEAACAAYDEPRLCELLKGLVPEFGEGGEGSAEPPPNNVIPLERVKR